MLIPGWEAQNRATDGDVVAIEMLPREKWLAAASKMGENDEAGGELEDEELTEATSKPCARVIG